MAKISQIEQEGTYYDIYDEEAIHEMPTAADLGAEVTSNKTTIITGDSTNTEYPSAKAVWALVDTKQDSITLTQAITESSTENEFPSAAAVWDLFTSITDFEEVLF